MSIALPRGLPAWQALVAEGVDVRSADDLCSPGQRPLRLCLVNLMPTKIATETQIARLLGGTAIPVELILCLPDSYRSKTTPAEHIASFYRRWSQLRDESFDGLIVTGAPIETLPFEEVDYWSELCAIFDWAQARTISSFNICWAGQAALRHFHGVPKHLLPEKKFGVFGHRVTSADAPLLRGFSEEFPVAVSRHTEVQAADLPARAGLTVLAASAETGLCLIEDRARRAIFMFNHLEYDTGTLAEEFLRDQRAGKPIAIPHNYFPDDDPMRPPVNSWRPYGHLLFANWLGEMDRTARRAAADGSRGRSAAPGVNCSKEDVSDGAQMERQGQEQGAVAGVCRSDGAEGDLGLADRGERRRVQSAVQAAQMRRDAGDVGRSSHSRRRRRRRPGRGGQRADRLQV
jgi:homoserine O-succinyltransferase